MTTPNHHFIHRLTFETRGRSLHDVTACVRSALYDEQAGSGMATLFIRHTSASLTIQENADPDVREDLLDSLDRLAPANAGYRHDVEGPDDMPAHVKTMLTGTSLCVPVEEGELLLGTWQGIYLAEHRAAAHRREVVIHFIGSRLRG